MRFFYRQTQQSSLKLLKLKAAFTRAAAKNMNIAKDKNSEENLPIHGNETIVNRTDTNIKKRKILSFFAEAFYKCFEFLAKFDM